MKIVILSASPKNENSVTLQVGKLIEKMSQFSVKDEFTELLIGNGKYTEEIGEKIKQADLVMFCSSLFHFSVPQQLMLFLNSVEENIGNEIQGKPVTYFTTSSQLMDTEAHSYMQKRLKRMGVLYIRGLSLLDVDILEEEGREKVGNWYHYVRSYVLKQNEKFKNSNSQIVLLDATDGTNMKINNSIEKAKKYFENVGAGKIIQIALKDYKINQCQACSYCYADEKCIFKDDFEPLCDKIYKNTDIIITFGELQDGLLGPIHKVWLDRHVKFGLHPLENEIIYAYMVDMQNAKNGDKYALDVHEKALTNFNKDYYMGICDINNEKQVEYYYEDIIKTYNYELYPQTNYYSRGTFFIFKSIAWTIQKFAPKNFKYYSKNNGYKLPEPNINIQSFSDYKGAIQVSKNRLIPYKMVLESLKQDCSLQTERRKNNSWNKQEDVSLQKYEPKIGFFAKLLAKFKNKKK